MDTIPDFLEDRLQRIEGWIRDLHIRTGGFAPPPPPPEPTAAELEAAHPANQVKALPPPEESSNEVES